MPELDDLPDFKVDPTTRPGEPEAPEAQAAPEAAPEEKEEPRRSERDATIDQIVANRRHQTRPEEVEPQPVDEDDPEVLLKVDGEERAVPRSRVLEAGVRTLQKETAADARLQQAAEQLRLLEQREQQLRARENQIRQAEQARQAKQPPPTQAVDKKLYKQVSEAIYSGDEEETAKALERLIAAARPTQQSQPQIDPTAIAAQAAEGAARLVELQSARTDFVKEYPEIAQDQRLWNTANQATMDLAKEHPEWTPRQVIMEAGKQVRSWLRSKTPQDAPTGKEARKEAMDVVTGGTARQKTPPPPPPKTRSQVVEDMRKSRGLPT